MLVLTDPGLLCCISGPDDLGEVMVYTSTLNHKWFHLGLSLGLSYSTLKCIEASHHYDVGSHMTDVLLQWLRNVDHVLIESAKPPSWGALVLALESNLVRERPTAQRVLRDHPMPDTTFL